MVFMQGLWGEAEWNKEPDGATAQEVYYTAKYVFNHQTGSGKKPTARPEPGRYLENEDKCLGRGRETSDLHLQELAALMSLTFTSRCSQCVEIFFF